MRQFLSAFATGLGYILLLVSWLWLLLVGLPPLIEGGTLDMLLPKERGEQATPTPEPQGLSPIAVVSVAVITSFMLILTVVTLWRLPKAILKSGDRVVHSASQKALPIITHHKPLPAKKRKQLSLRLILLMQIIIVIIPFFGLLPLSTPEELPKEAIVAMSAMTTIGGVLCFLIGYLLKASKITSQTRLRASRG